MVSARGCLSNLSRTTDQEHLSVSVQMILEDRIINSCTLAHKTNFHTIVKWSSLFYDAS